MARRNRREDRRRRRCFVAGRLPRTLSCINACRSPPLAYCCCRVVRCGNFIYGRSVWQCGRSFRVRRNAAHPLAHAHHVLRGAAMDPSSHTFEIPASPACRKTYWRCAAGSPHARVRHRHSAQFSFRCCRYVVVRGFSRLSAMARNSRACASFNLTGRYIRPSSASAERWRYATFLNQSR
jgi:hypothetical protein